MKRIVKDDTYLPRKIKTNIVRRFFIRQNWCTYISKKKKRKEEKGRGKISKAVIHRSFHMTNVHFKQTLNGHFAWEWNALLNVKGTKKNAALRVSSLCVCSWIELQASKGNCAHELRRLPHRMKARGGIRWHLKRKRAIPR